MSLVILRDNGQSLTFDSVSSEDYTPSLTITAHPIEGGSSISEHAQVNQTTLIANCLITESPLAQSGGGFKAIEDALSFLKAIEGELVTIVSSKLGSMSSMMVTSYPYKITVAGNLPVSIRAIEINTATSTTIRIPASQPTTNHNTGAPDNKRQGQQAGTEVSKSLLASMYDFVSSN